VTVCIDEGFAILRDNNDRSARINLGCEVRGVDLKTEARPEGISALMLYLPYRNCQ